MPQDLTVDIRHNPSLDYTVLPRQRTGSESSQSHGEPPDLNVVLRHNGEDELGILIWGQAVSPLRTRSPRASLTVPASTLVQKAARLRSIWRDRVVRHAQTIDGEDRFPLAETANLSAHAELMDRLTGEMAEEGAYLLDCLLGGDSHEERSLRAVFMAALSGERSLRISFDSELYLPWPMLSLDPTEHGGPWRSFLGYRHQIEQTGGPWPIPDFGWGSRAQAITSLNTDTQLDAVGRAPDVRKLLEERSRLTVRTEAAPLLEALSGPEFDEDLMYFWCHGHFVDNGSPHPHLVLRLSDEQHIDADSVELRRSRIKSPTRARFKPFVLLNACHAGQAAAAPQLEHLGRALIKFGADGVLGPQIEIPQDFASEYAYEFLHLYLAGEHTAGEISRALVRRFAKDFHNPLALTYSLHCGLDSKLDLSS
ncbi:CHAT domain-containing protein [Streptomyces broussonetiae]|uniref:CHAT domain-containing protein n=1 Tax=Streptomyces broussonetiae TaxID=2686304 RepID=A0A6I6MZ75_9ACTN|nr:CHAT domain-containing protein [Streptomyces broussonetiae]QHA06138.1 CHAT domain-containing protein [Streptomyces broussonetiae]